jgi:hypothetical protein
VISRANQVALYYFRASTASLRARWGAKEETRRDEQSEAAADRGFDALRDPDGGE